MVHDHQWIQFAIIYVSHTLLTAVVKIKHSLTADPMTQQTQCTCRHSQVSLPEPVGCIGLTEDPNIVLAALKRSIVLFDLAKGEVIRSVTLH